MAKSGEKAYFTSLSPGEQQHASSKPFSDKNPGKLLIQLGTATQFFPGPSASVLDMGCGTGWTSWFMARMGYAVTGQDISEDMIVQARENARENVQGHVDFVVSDYESLAFENDFDCVLFFDSLHHAVDEEGALRSAFRALKDGGVCVLSEPGRGHSKSPGSIRAMQEFNVTEKDMPPYHTMKLARKIGFSGAKVYPHFSYLNDYLLVKPDTGLKRLLKLPFVPEMATLFYLFIKKRTDGLVVLTK